MKLTHSVIHGLFPVQMINAAFRKSSVTYNSIYCKAGKQVLDQLVPSTHTQSPLDIDMRVQGKFEHTGTVVT